MREGGIDRRGLLKAGSSLGVVGLAGCSEQSLEDDSSTSNSSDTDDEGGSGDEPSKPEELDAEDYTLTEDHTVAEWRGLLELNDEQPYWMQKISPQDLGGEDVVGISDCLFLECEVEVPVYGEKAELFLISDRNEEAFREKARPEICREIGPVFGYSWELECTPNLEQYHSGGVEEEVFVIEPGETKYVRYMVPGTDFWLVVDPTDAVDTGLLDGNRSVVQMDLEPKVRLLEDSSKVAQQSVLEEFDKWFSELDSSSTDETVGSVQKFAQDVCESGSTSELSSKSVDEFSNDVQRFDQYTSFADDLMTDIDEHFPVDPPTDFSNYLSKMLNWGSTALPVIASLITVAEKSCELANADSNLPDDEMGEKVENLLMSVAGLVVQVTFLKLGVARQVKRSTIQAAETFVLGYVRQLAGLRLFAHVVNSLAVQIENGIIGTIVDFVERIVSEVSELLVDSDEGLLDLVGEDDDWDDLAFLDEDKWVCEGYGQDVVADSIEI